MGAGIHYFGIRHHGPGSARRLLDALEALKPSMLLVEGPADASSQLPALAHAAMLPPVALLCHATDQPELSSFYPFAEFSPEYQAIRWALNAGVPVEFIDLPANVQLAMRKNEEEARANAGDADAGDDVDVRAEESEAASADAPAAADDPHRIVRDPIGTLAKLAGYEDGESWWHDWLESGVSGEQAAFTLVEDMMAALREASPDPVLRERQREAHMRQAIANAARGVEGDVAVVCGAWHVPALRAKSRVADDKALLRGLPKLPVRHTWVPWTGPRLAFASGYGAGVDAPRWYAHLWQHGAGGEALSHWMVTVARVLRDGGAQASPASVIETVRLAEALAQLRERPAAGYEEMRDAVVACLCGGEPLAWAQHEAELLLGSDVGEIPPDTPLMPLLEDLQRQQKAVRLKPEALERELSLDLRSESGAARSLLLHRLRLLDVPWGVQNDAGGSRGTFRERWTLRWEPEFSVRLVENLVHGTTIEQAAGRRSIARLHAERRMSALASLINACMEARLEAAVGIGIDLLADAAACAQECLDMLSALPPLVSLRRYGSARQLQLDQLDGLVERLLQQAAVALPHAARNLDAEQSRALCEALANWQAALAIADIDPDPVELWWATLIRLLDDPQANRRVDGLLGRLLHEAGRIDVVQVQDLMRRMLSPGVDSTEAALFFEGFFDGAASQLLHQRELLDGVDDWFASLDAGTFQQQLPLFRRVLSSLDANERRRLLERVLSPQAALAEDARFDLRHLDEWTAHAVRLQALLGRREVAWPT